MCVVDCSTELGQSYVIECVCVVDCSTELGQNYVIECVCGGLPYLDKAMS